MRNKDWSLVFFTLLSQLSVGIVLWLALLAVFFTGTSLSFETGFSPINPVSIALGLIVIATVSSFLHLGNPSNAPNALNNLSGSWLSREILAINVYVLSLLATMLLGRYSANSEAMTYMLLLSSLAGLVLLWMMVRVYAIPTIPSWNSWYTPLSFGASTICLGLLALLMFQHTGVVHVDSQTRIGLTILLMLILLIEVASALFNQLKLEKMHTGIDGPVFDRGAFHTMFLLRAGMLITAFVLVFVFIVNPAALPGNSGHTWLYAMLALIIAAQITGRVLFYASYFRLGV